MSNIFTPNDLEEIREFVNSIEHSAYIPAPQPDRVRLDVTVIVHDAIGDVAVVARISSDDPLITFPAAVTGEQLRALLDEDKA